MSTVDPVEARRRREAARLGSPAALVGVFVGLVMIAVGAALVMRAVFGFIGLEADAASSPGTDVGEPPLAVVGLVAGLPLLIAGFFVHTTASRRFTGRLLSAPVVGPLSLLVVGLAAGGWWGLPALPAPGALWVLPAVLTALAVLLLVLGAAGRLRRRARGEVLAHLLAHGRIVPGVIVEIPQIDPSSGGLLGSVTVRFTDTAGVDRWVQKLGQWSRDELPVTGDPAAVLFDPERPADTARIWVAPAGSTGAADFTRWHS